MEMQLVFTRRDVPRFDAVEAEVDPRRLTVPAFQGQPNVTTMWSNLPRP
jgi:hypothetical protein